MFRSIQSRIAAVYLLLLGGALAALASYLIATLTQPATLAPADVATIITQAAYITFAFAAFAGFMAAALLARLTTRPLRQLAEIADGMAAGTLPDTITVSSRDEVAELAAALTAMARALGRNLQSLEAERARLAAVLASMADGVLIADADGRVLLINAAAARMLRVSAADSRGRTLIEVLRDHELADLARRGLDRPDGTPAQVIEVGQPRRYLQAVATRLPDAPGPRVLLVLQDVSDLRQTEIIRREFVANVSHELRTPVASLRALLEVLEDGAIDDPEVSRDFLGRMHVEVDGLLQLIEELMELARLEAGRAMQTATVDIGQVTAQAVERMRAQAERQGVSLHLTPPEPLPPVKADAVRVAQVLINLIHNAIKFTPPGGKVMVSAVAGPDGVRVAVADTGEGIARDDLPRIFERFYKADRSRASGGTGLGLAIAKHTMQAHGGRIWAESAGPGRGAVFTLVLPRVGDKAGVERG